MRFIKNNFKIVIGFIIGVVLATSITVYATTYLAGDVSYTRGGNTTNVSSALDDLYSMLPTGTQNITTNGNYSVTNKASVNVNVINGKKGTATITNGTNNYVVLETGFRPNYIILVTDGTWYNSDAKLNCSMQSSWYLSYNSSLSKYDEKRKLAAHLYK